MDFISAEIFTRFRKECDLPEGADLKSHRSDHGGTACGDCDLEYHQSSEPDRDKTARVVHAAQGDGVMEFGLRRAQGPDAGLYGARAAMIGGCVGTSNVLAGKMFDVPIMGTHAHSWIMSFPDEYTAFKPMPNYIRMHVPFGGHL